MKDHLAARLRPPSLDKAEMPRRDRRAQGQLELAEVAALTPLAKQRPRGRCTLAEGHAGTLTGSLPICDNRDGLRQPTSEVIDARTWRRHDRTRRPEWEQARDLTAITPAPGLRRGRSRTRRSRPGRGCVTCRSAPGQRR